MTSKATHINGCEIKLSYITLYDNSTRPGRIVLVEDTSAPGNSIGRWITAWQGRDRTKPEPEGWDDEWSNGHYFKFKYDAKQDFEKRTEQARQFGSR